MCWFCMCPCYRKRICKCDTKKLLEKIARSELAATNKAWCGGGFPAQETAEFILFGAGYDDWDEVWMEACEDRENHGTLSPRCPSRHRLRDLSGAVVNHSSRN
mmetsp:Transcript_37063/g.57950  ORF Transcript_37063/g.57950 Transcript_37063/m.57950 type:complete len:103 (-) Transcript_37063:197-505(-)